MIFHWSAGFGVGGLLLILMLRASLQVDKSARGDADPWMSEAPATVNDPFAETLRERDIKALYKEPVQATALSLNAPPAAKSNNGGGAENVVAEATMKRARAIYQERCAACHGDKGDGNGLGAFAIKPKPRDYTDPEWQKTVTDEELSTAIVRGGTAVGKSYMMPANRDLKSKPDVVEAIVAMVRSFASK
jgi:mono/diheme cytochrome c family protein